MYSVKSVLLQVGLFCIGMSLQAQTTYYVKAGSQGNGLSWAQAFGDLQQALTAAQAGDEIWVARGKYFTTRSGNRNARFTISDGVAVYGGFAGFETDRAQRNPKQHLTVLSGEIGGPGAEDNAYTVVYTRGVGARTLVDGFIITGGMANGNGKAGDLQACGAGWFNDGSNGSSKPTVRNCIFSNNMAHNGAGMYNYGYRGEASPRLENCRFERNVANIDGGGVYNNGANGISDTQIFNSKFSQNEATYGAGVFNTGEHGQTKPFIKDCLFEKNNSYVSGSGIYNFVKGKGVCEPMVQRCRFENNYATVGNEVGSNASAALSGSSSKSSMTLRTSGF
jgi:hypothetical protein